MTPSPTSPGGSRATLPVRSVVRGAFVITRRGALSAGHRSGESAGRAASAVAITRRGALAGGATLAAAACSSERTPAESAPPVSTPARPTATPRPTIVPLATPVPDPTPVARRAVADPSPARLPRWRGFNLLEKFQLSQGNRRFEERDFAAMAEWGFDFVRLPMDYRCWVETGDWTAFREGTLAEIDEAVRFGEQYGIHVCLNFHRAPGYTVASPPEQMSVWTDEEAQRVCALHWARFAERYAGIPNRRLSFNLFNEPAKLDPPVHRAVVARMMDAIRAYDAQRLVICDGRDYGVTPPVELAGLDVATATRGYDPFRLTHYRAEWVKGAETWPLPSYPLRDGATLWDKTTLQAQRVAPWQRLEAQGIGVMVGEFGAYNKAPHAVVLAWLRDYLDLWKQTGWGWALWNFRGSFGMLDSGRADVPYEAWQGHRLDRAMLDALLQG